MMMTLATGCHNSAFDVFIASRGNCLFQMLIRIVGPAADIFSAWPDTFEDQTAWAACRSGDAATGRHVQQFFGPQLIDCG